jgi:hypothetical protein
MVGVLVCIGLVFMYYQVKQMENQRIIEDKRLQVINLLQNELEHFDPVLEAFIDEDYLSVIAIEVSQKGIYKFERGLAKEKVPFGIYIVSYDLENMKFLSKELKITNNKYFEEWETFKKKN